MTKAYFYLIVFNDSFLSLQGKMYIGNGANYSMNQAQGVWFLENSEIPLAPALRPRWCSHYCIDISTTGDNACKPRQDWRAKLNLLPCEPAINRWNQKEYLLDRAREIREYASEDGAVINLRCL